MNPIRPKTSYCSILLIALTLWLAFFCQNAVADLLWSHPIEGAHPNSINLGHAGVLDRSVYTYYYEDSHYHVIFIDDKGIRPVQSFSGAEIKISSITRSDDIAYLNGLKTVPPANKEDVQRAIPGYMPLTEDGAFMHPHDFQSLFQDPVRGDMVSSRPGVFYLWKIYSVADRNMRWYLTYGGRIHAIRTDAAAPGPPFQMFPSKDGRRLVAAAIGPTMRGVPYIWSLENDFVPKKLLENNELRRHSILVQGISDDASKVVIQKSSVRSDGEYYIIDLTNPQYKLTAMLSSNKKHINQETGSMYYVSSDENNDIYFLMTRHNEESDTILVGRPNPDGTFRITDLCPSLDRISGRKHTDIYRAALDVEQKLIFVYAASVSGQEYLYCMDLDDVK